MTPAAPPLPDPAVEPDAVLGLLLGTLRVQAGLTLEAAAVASGLPAARIRGVEAGDGLLPFADARDLARAYGLPFVAFAARFERALAAAERRARRRGGGDTAVGIHLVRARSLVPAGSHATASVTPQEGSR